jgi:hypothetical protein
MRNIRLFAVTAAVAALSVVGATGALAGEIKGPPYQGPPVAGGIGDASNSTAAVTNGHASICAFSGLNDFDSLEGQTTKQTQTPADGPHGAPGLGLEVAPGVFVSCRGN